MSEKSRSTERAKISTVEQISAGGVAFRQTGAAFEIAVIAANPSRPRWQLPKGIVDKDETPEVAALREVREEAGIECALIEKIETIEYWYVGANRQHEERVRFHKFVHLFLMKYVSGETTNHDHEVIEARWVKIEEAVERLAFKGEKTVVEKASQILARRNNE